MTKQFSNSSGNHFDYKFRIESHDIQLHLERPIDKDGMVAPLVKGVLLHLAILGFIVFANLPPTLIQQTPVQASLVNSDDLATIRSQILANRSQAAKSNNESNATAIHPSGGATKSETANSVPVNVSSDGTVIPTSSNSEQRLVKNIEPSPEAKKRNELLEKRQQEFNEALENFEKQEDRQYQEKKQELITQKQEEQKQEQELVDEFKSAEQKTDKIVEENRNQFSEEERKRAEEQSKNRARQNATTSGSLANDGTPNTGYSGDSHSSSGSNQTKADNAALALSKIKRFLNPPLGSGGDTSKLIITVDANGNVTKAEAKGSNKDLNIAAEQAAISASPLPIKRGDKHYPTLTVRIDGQGTL